MDQGNKDHGEAMVETDVRESNTRGYSTEGVKSSTEDGTVLMTSGRWIAIGTRRFGFLRLEGNTHEKM